MQSTKMKKKNLNDYSDFIEAIKFSKIFLKHKRMLKALHWFQPEVVIVGKSQIVLTIII